MKKTSIGLLVLLAICSLSLTLTPAAISQSAPTNVKVVSYSYYFDTTGFLVVVGEVQNVGTDPVSSVTLSGIATSSDGAEVTSDINALVVDLLPGQKAPFYWNFYDTTGTGTWNHPDVTSLNIAVTQASTTTSYQYPDMKITGTSSSIGTNRGTSADDPNADYGAYWVTGTLQNTGSQTATNVRLIATYYNASGVAVAVGGYIDQVMNATLAPSQSTQFKIGAYDLNQTGIVSEKKITSYSMLIQVEAPILQENTTELPTVTPYPTGGTVEPTTSATTSPTSTGSSSIGVSAPGSSGWILAVIAVLVIVAVAAIILSIKKMQKPTSR
jgi:hypothetical protein